MAVKTLTGLPPGSYQVWTASNILSGKNGKVVIPLPNNTAGGYTIPTLYSGFFTGPTQENEYPDKFDDSLTDKVHRAAGALAGQVTFSDYY